VLGCSQRQLRADIERRLHGRVPLLERDAGGGAVLTGPWLVSVSVVLPHAHPWVAGGLVDSYRRIAQVHVAALHEIGVRARALPPNALPRADASSVNRGVDWACFGALSPWEVVDAQGRKLVGLAQQRRQSGVLLVAGTLVGSPDWTLLCDAMGYPGDEHALRECTVSAKDIAGCDIEPHRFAGVLTRSLHRHIGDSAAQMRPWSPTVTGIRKEA
jgi:lipoate---protein ligase